ncbi:hypothetical protein EIP91_005615 [Steccherinum ochraceum]|uniref:F-box domain-containing protein n=1 Tax=Steccherinum ochraceum TaxID=92696 RepID=A0A4R0RM50_9APHY|nr:hypothetical protein EIP91_005615 [Steccherinum ochraceum]
MPCSKKQKLTLESRHKHKATKPKAPRPSFPLHDDILRLVLEFAVQRDDLVGIDSFLLPFFLSFVSTQWRAVMIDCSSAWSNIIFDMSKSLNVDEDTLLSEEFVKNKSGLRLVKLALARSKARPLRITVFPNFDEDISRRRLHENHRLQKFFELMTPVLDRIESLDITTSDSAVSTWLAKHVEKLPDMPLLENLSLVCDDPFHTKNQEFFTAQVRRPKPGPCRLMDAPKLKSLVLSVTHFFTAAGVTQVFDGLAHLQSLTLTGFCREVEGALNPYVVLSYVAQIPGLLHLELAGSVDRRNNDFLDVFERPQNSPDRYLLPVLQSLTLRRLLGPWQHELLRSLDAPSLESLTLKDGLFNDWIGSTFEHIKAPGYFPSLHTLVVDGCCYGLWQEILFHIPWVVTLTIVDTYECRCPSKHTFSFGHDVVFQPVLEKRWWVGNEYFCSKLQSLTIEVHGTRHCKDLRSMVRDRWLLSRRRNVYKPPTVLQNLTVLDCYCHEPLPDVYREAFERYTVNFHGPERVYEVQEPVLLRPEPTWFKTSEPDLNTGLREPLSLYVKYLD